MPTFKVTRVYVLDAPSRSEALDQVADATLEFESVRQVLTEAPTRGNPWLAEAKRQLLGGDDRPMPPARTHDQW